MSLLWIEKNQYRIAGELSSELGLSPSKSTRCLKELVASGLVDETLDNNDLRKCHFRVSGKGINVSYEIAETFGEIVIAGQLRWFASLRHAAQNATKTFGQRLTGTAQCLLLTLNETPDTLSVGQLCLETSLPQSRVSMSLKTLVKSGDVEKIPSGGDARIHHYALSRQGHTLADTMMSELAF